MTAELLLAISALCDEGATSNKFCKTALIECVNQSDTKDADAAAQCYWDLVMKGPWCPDPNDKRYQIDPEVLKKLPKKMEDK